ncbi:site-specific tyrosine recombinase XerC [Yersinia pseudotuberculosis]|uniref:Site-specific tyrosine recombinase XerC n=2 Tax=Yersinia pseudotuberculosis TaxID=633 RepID=A0A380Q3E6_YERPU|nr:site-specific tyrosine recombinase XerC [Yersinia pseudotuberculosis]
MNTIIMYYNYCMDEDLIKFNNINKPFNIQILNTEHRHLFPNTNRRFTVRTSDLSIRVFRNIEENSLKPLSLKNIDRFIEVINSEAVEYRLMFLLQLNSGLRIEEATKTTQYHIRKVISGERIIEITIGTNSPAKWKTKNDKTRTIEINNIMMDLLYRYCISPRRTERLAKGKIKSDIKTAPLFINQYGREFSVASVSQAFQRVRKKLKENGDFEHRNHDLRATYGTYRLDELLNTKNSNNQSVLTTSEALSQLMTWMGHKNASTTMRYIHYLKAHESKVKASGIFDRILHYALQEVYSG